MRIVGGIYKGRTLLEFKGQAVRPTSDMARESLFNILQFKIAGKTFLDLFCGTGAVGIEALSRGAKGVVFNDLSRESVNLTRQNLIKIGSPENAVVYNRNAQDFHLFTNEKFDFIFIDAPYKSDAGLLALSTAHLMLNDGGTVIYENEVPFNQTVDGLEKVDERRYGRAHLTFFEKAKQSACVFAGTFDPVTIGHVDIIEKCEKKFDKVYVVIGQNPQKKSLFTQSQREDLLKLCFKNNKKVEVLCYSALKENYAEYLKKQGVTVYVRGIRNEIDLEYEKKSEQVNKSLYPFITTEYIECENQFKGVSSTLVKEQILKGDYSNIPNSITQKIKEFLQQK
ncbi:MAG: 16S rRNA (guanine(966)-N(2))-methyltransferase RsmD [Clostridia bacterium]|nr:16S rRNA (guanine(966)-N(2))-methyltransferase RsmD [Clostridia bacterium]